MAFVHDLTKAFPDSSGVLGDLKVRPDPGDETALADSLDDDNVLTTAEPTTITHRRGQTKFLEPVDEDRRGHSRRSAGQRPKLCRLAFELAKAPDINAIARLALAGVFEGTEIDAGAMLLLPRTVVDEPAGADLEVIASRTDSDFPYHRVSNFLAVDRAPRRRGRARPQCDRR